MAQKLSKEAALKKAVRDKAFAMTDERRAKKASSQKYRRAKKRSGFNLRGQDVHHDPKTGRMSLVSVNKNRGSLMVKDKESR